MATNRRGFSAKAGARPERRGAKGAGMNDPAKRGGWVALWRSPEFFEMLEKYPNAFLLLTLISMRARYSSSSSLDELRPGEALIGDYTACGLTEQKYRTAKAQLAKWRFATFRATTKGTVAKLLPNPIYEHEYKPSNEQGNGQPTDEQRTAND
jgi:hypothetical protein